MIGFSLSPGGLLLPYHLGVIAALSYHGHLTDDTPLSGSSAGAIAVAAHATGVPTAVALEASMRISAQCTPWFLARGNLERSLWQQLDTLFPADAAEVVNARPGLVGLAHLQLYPGPSKPVLATQDFESRRALMHAVCDSSMFPYFTSNRPFRVVHDDGIGKKQRKQPRVTVDGVFTEPLWRFGCPDMAKHQKEQVANLDRTVCISVFPKELVGLQLTSLQDHDNKNNNIIAPPLNVHNPVGQATRLALLMCTRGRRRDLKQLYEDGWHNAEQWVHREEEQKAVTEPVRLPMMRS